MKIRTKPRSTERTIDSSESDLHQDRTVRAIHLALLITTAIGTLFVLHLARHVATSEAIVTPWPLLPHGILGAIIALFLCTLLLVFTRAPSFILAISTALSVASITTVVPLIYRLGVGFDGFLHRASEQLLLTSGALHPKPPYYIGQYVFVDWLVRAWHIPLFWADTLLVPLSAALLPCVFALIPGSTRWKIPVFALLLPLSVFIASTPQSFGYILGLCAVILAIAAQTRRIHPLCVWSCAAWSLAIHPLAGLPFLGCVISLEALQRTNDWRHWSVLSSIFATACSIPAAFVLFGLQAPGRLVWHLDHWLQPDTWNISLFTWQPPASVTSIWTDWTQLLIFIFPLVLILLSIIAIWKDARCRQTWILITLTAAGLVLAAEILAISCDFPFLISYERGDYLNRFLLIAALLLVLPACEGLGRIVNACLKRDAWSIMAFLFLLGGAQAAHAYVSLPYHDEAHAEHGWSVSAADVEAARWINQNAHGQPYTVLANQSVSAAAISLYGFQRYAGDVFYYPVPTGGPLYQLFLRVVGDDGSRKTICQAATLGQSSSVYVVIDAYWWQAKTVNAELASIADATQRIQQGKDIIYRFTCP